MNFLSSCPALVLPNTDSLFASKQLKVQALVWAKDFLCFHLTLTQLEFLGSRQSSLTRNSSSTQGMFDISAWGAATAAWGHLTLQKCSNFLEKLCWNPPAISLSSPFTLKIHSLQQSQLPENDLASGLGLPFLTKIVTFLLSLFWGYCSLTNLFREMGKNLPFLCF